MAHRGVIACLVCVAIACQSREDVPSTDTNPSDARDSAVIPSDPSDPDPAGAARARVGVIFDPLTLRPGDTVAGLVVESLSVQRAAADSTPVGTVRFRGSLELSGRAIPHFDPDARGPTAPVCFEADSTSAARMPRWEGDRRRPWFCLTNTTEARRALGSADTTQQFRGRIVVDRFTIHRGFSDQVNSARYRRTVP